MKYRSVGKSGLKISEVALGSWVTDLKGTAAEDVAKETVSSPTIPASTSSTARTPILAARPNASSARR